MIHRFGIYVMLLCCALSMAGCEKGGCNVIPHVQIRTSFSQATAGSAWSVGGSAFLSGGVTGIAIYNRGLSSGGSYDFRAYDRCSTVNPEQRNSIINDPDNPSLFLDPVSGAKWLKIDGSPTHIAECSLRQYSVTRTGQLYYVSN